MNKTFLAVLTAITAAILMACGAPSQVAQVKTQPTAEAQPTVVATAQPTLVPGHKSGPSYWSMPDSKAFKAIEYSCYQGWKGDMGNGCVVVIDRAGEGFTHDGVSAPFGIVIPTEKGVTIHPVGCWDCIVFVAPEPKRYTFVVLSRQNNVIVSQFTTTAPKWDEELLKGFFVTQMGGDVSTIWREGVSVGIDN